jgi:hypothetical protein
VKGHLHSRGTQLGETQCCSYMLATAGPIFASSRLPEVVDFTSDLEWRVEACDQCDKGKLTSIMVVMALLDTEESVT